MTPRVVITPRARSDLVEIGTYIGRDNAAAAERLIDQLEARSLLLAGRPGLGRPYGPRPGVRLSSLRHYVIAYRETEGGIEVLRYLHARRDISRLL